MEKLIEEEGLEYKIFYESFALLRIIGFWKPSRFKQCWSQLCYSVYTIISCTSLVWLSLGMLVYVAVSGGDYLNNLAENWCLAIVVANNCYKVANLLIKRKKIIKFLRTKIMVERWTRLRDAEEMKIVEAFNQTERNIPVRWMSLVAANDVINILNPIVMSNPNHLLIYKSYIPCDCSVKSCFWLFWCIQCFSYTISSITHVCCDCLTFDMCERVCSHVRLFQHRLSLLPDLVNKGVISNAEEEMRYLIDCIQQHQEIYANAREISNLFGVMINVHFMLNCSVICTSIYLLANVPLLSNAFLGGLLYLMCMLTMCLVHCWYGYRLNEISDDISYTIFSMDWFLLRKDSIKLLRFIMLAGSKSIPLFNNFIVELSPAMFVKILKISYSTFNLLQTQR